MSACCPKRGLAQLAQHALFLMLVLQLAAGPPGHPHSVSSPHRLFRVAVACALRPYLPPTIEHARPMWA